MKRILFFLTFCAFVLPVTLLAQEPNAQLVKDWERAKAYTKEYLDAMPEDGYAYKPTKEMRSFAQQMLHLADANYGLGSSALGATSPYKFGDIEKTTDQSKMNTTKIVMDSYDFVIKGIKSMDAQKFSENVKLFGNEMTRAVALGKTFEHQTHHRGQTTVYLRLKGVTPPQEKLF